MISLEVLRAQLQDLVRGDTQPVLEHYAAQVVKIDGMGSMDEITARILGALTVKP